MTCLTCIRHFCVCYIHFRFETCSLVHPAHLPLSCPPLRDLQQRRESTQNGDLPWKRLLSENVHGCLCPRLSWAHACARICRRDSSMVKEEIKAFLGNRRISQAVVAQVTGESTHPLSGCPVAGSMSPPCCLNMLLWGGAGATWVSLMWAAVFTSDRLCGCLQFQQMCTFISAARSSSAKVPSGFTGNRGRIQKPTLPKQSDE